MGWPTPAWEARPEFMPEGLPAWEVFNVLCRRRQAGMGPTPIPVSEILSALDMFGYTDPDERITMYALIDALDDAWLRWAREKVDKDTK